MYYRFVVVAFFVWYSCCYCCCSYFHLVWLKCVFQLEWILYLFVAHRCVCVCARFIWKDFNYFSLFIFHAASMHCTFFARHFFFSFHFAWLLQLFFFFFCGFFSRTHWFPCFYASIPYCKWIGILSELAWPEQNAHTYIRAQKMEYGICIVKIILDAIRLKRSLN